MSRAVVNTTLVIGACVVYVVLAAWSGRTSINGGLGAQGSVYAAMAIDRNLQAAPAVMKLAAAFPLATAIAYTATGNAVASFLAVTIAAFVVLVFAACWLLDLLSAPSSLKIVTVATLCVLGVPSLTSAFDPGHPVLLGVALATLGVAAAEWGSGVVTGILHIGATLGSPVGIVAPLYGIWRHIRARRPPAKALVYLPALLVWLAVQYWARGGAAGLGDLISVSRVRADAAFWTESAFVTYAVYFLLTALGGLTLLLWADPRAIQETVSSRPAVLALFVPAIPFIATAGLELPRVLAFLLPLWLILVAEWGRRNAMRLMIPLLLACVLTLLTQHPWMRMTDTSYFVDWFPYSVSAGRVDVTRAGFDAVWRVRILIAAAGLAAFVVWRRKFVR